MDEGRRTLYCVLVGVTVICQLQLARCAISELYDTKIATSDLKWTLGPDPSVYTWEEVSVYGAPTKNVIRAYQICRSGESNNDNWIRTPFMHAQGATRLHIELKYSIQKCSSLGLDEFGASLCRETFNVFYYPSDSDVATSTFPPWKHRPYVKIDTVAANTNTGINQKTFTIDGLQKNGVYLAFQDQGACMSLISVRVYYFYCPETSKNLATFPRTITGDDSASLVGVPGKCVQNAYSKQYQIPKYYCGGNGEWKIATGSCYCDAGTEPNSRSTSCKACPHGTYKSVKGNAKCIQCPANSGRKEVMGHVTDPHSVSTPSFSLPVTVCSCHKGYFRSKEDSIHDSCTQPPTSPVIVTSQFNSTTAYLEWQPPQSTGGRSDVYYRLECEMCGRSSLCVACPRQITFIAENKNYDFEIIEISRFQQTAVFITNMEPYSKYNFKIFAMNGVSKISKSEPKYELVAIETAEDVPFPIANVYVATFTTNTAEVKWREPQQPRGKIIMYEVEVRLKSEGERTTRSSPHRNTIENDENAIIQTSDINSIALMELTPNTEYEVRVRARTSVGFGDFGPPVAFTTEPDVNIGAGQIGSGRTSLLIGSIVAMVAIVGGCFVSVMLCSKRRKQLGNKNLPLTKKHVSSRYDEISETKQMAINKSEEERLNARDAQCQLQTTYIDHPDPQRAVLAMKMELPKERLHIEDTIGEGEFALVRKAKLFNGKDLTDVAVKQLKQGATPKDQSNFLREACIMAQFDHPNILKLKGVVTMEEPMMIVSEFMSNGSLDKYLIENKWTINMHTLLHFLRGIAAGMQYLCDMQYLHRDLAARNILVDRDGNCKVADFGLSRNFENDPNATYTTQGGKIALRWTAPESIRYKEFTSASDVWSFGIVMWEVMSYGEKPYWDMTNKEVIQNVSDGGRLPAPTRCPKAIHEMMLECWTIDPKKRPTFSKIVSDLSRLIRHSTLLETCITSQLNLSMKNETVADDSILSFGNAEHEDDVDSDSDLEGQVTVIMQERMLHV